MLPANGALFVLYEYAQAGFPPRPKHLHFGALGGPYECWGVKGYLSTFEDRRRYFQAQVVFGPHAPASLHAEVSRSLTLSTSTRSLRVSSRQRNFQAAR